MVTSMGGLAEDSEPWEAMAQARATWDRMARIGCDVVTPGGKDLRQGEDELNALFRRHPEIHVVSANVGSLTSTTWPQYVVLEKGGFRVGVTGVVNFPWREEPRTLNLLSPSQALREVLPRLRKEADVVILLVEGNYPSEFSEEVFPQVDVIIHSGPSKVAEGHLFLSRFGRSRGGFDVGHLTLDPEGRVVKQGILSLGCRPAPRVSSSPVMGLDQHEWSRWDQSQTLLDMRGIPGLRLDTVWDGATIRGRLSDKRGREIDFDWRRRAVSGDEETGLTGDPPPREPLPLRVVFPHISGADRVVPVGSLEEKAFIDVFQEIADRFFDRREQDSLLAGLDQAEDAPPRLSTKAERDALVVLRLARLLEEQRDRVTKGPSPYWERKGLVYLRLECAERGQVRQVEVLENNAWSSAADSLRRLASGWRISPPDRKSGEPRPFNRVVALAQDRRESRLPGLEVGRLPEAVRESLRVGALAGWTRALAQADPQFSLEDFRNGTAEPLAALKPDTALDSLVVQQHDAIGLLHHGYEWILDPFADLVIDTDGHPVSKGSAMAMLVSRRGDAYFGRYRVIGLDFDQGAWVDYARFVLVGWTPVEHPRFASGAWSTLRVPAVWVGDLKEGTVHVFRGVPVPPTAENAVREALAEARRRAYPKAGFP